MPHQTLLHFSENPDIRVFEPHIPASAPDNPPMVWAVDEEHAPGFWFPRDAPRACCWSIGKPLTGIGRSLLGMGGVTRMHAIESEWLERMRDCKIYMYRFDATPFRIHDIPAGYFAATEIITPLSVERIGDLLALHVKASVELRIVPDLWPVIDAIVASGLEFSIIRKSNAKPRDASSSAV
jgi:hypothetical protein